MTEQHLPLVFFPYGLAFFSMGLIIVLERGRASDARLRHALSPLAVFGILHGLHEWLEMFQILEELPLQEQGHLAWDGLRLGLLAFSFLSLSAFGASLLSPNERIRRISLLLPLVQGAIWGFGLLIMRGEYASAPRLWGAADVWTRYILGIPAALVACAGLIAQQRAFRRAGMARFGRDSLWAAIAFVWYGLVGQIFTRPSALPPSDIINQELFFSIFGFPVQVLRAAAAVGAAAFVIRFLRAFEVEMHRQIAALQEARVQEAKRRETQRGELLKRVVAAQEAERQRIARELHDETGQALTALGMGLRGVSTVLDHDMVGAVVNLRQLEDLVSHALDELQRLIADLRPSHLDDLGLPAALRWYGNEVQKRVPLNVVVEISGEARPIPGATKLTLFRIVQEALTNVIKHARANYAWVRMAFNEKGISLEIKDDGIGFDVNLLDNGGGRPSWGLLGMRERASLIEGEFYLDSYPGEGSCVRVMIPYEQEKEESDVHKTALG